MKVRQIVILLVATILALMAAGCKSTPGTTTLIITEADFQSDRNGLLQINNYASFDVAVFPEGLNAVILLAQSRQGVPGILIFPNCRTDPKKGPFCSG